MKEIKLLALFGKSGSGKDTIQNELLREFPDKYHKVISSTTRPKRDYEVEGVDYHYITKQTFQDGMLADRFVEALEFNGWFYGSCIDDFDIDKINIGIFTPEGIECLMSTAEDYHLRILPIYVKCSDVTRIFRSLRREFSPDIEELIRRYYTDERDFSIINFWHLDIRNDVQCSDPADLVEIIDNYCEDFFD